MTSSHCMGQVQGLGEVQGTGMGSMGPNIYNTEMFTLVQEKDKEPDS